MAIEIRSHPFKRRALHATTSFMPGQTIHAFTKPIISHPTLNHLKCFCSYCLKPNNPRACSRCHAAYYCGAECQKAGWATIHSKECNALRKSKAAELPTAVRVLMQALLSKDIEDGLAGLESNLASRRSMPGWADLEMMATGACAYAGKKSNDDVSRAIELLCKIQTNAFHRFDADLADQVGVFLEPTLAMANHSCIPNAAVLFMGRKAILRAERAVKAGDEIEISYIDYTYPDLQRQTALAEYAFACQCARCAGTLNVYQVCAQTTDLVQLNKNSVVGSSAPKLLQHPGATDQQRKDTAIKFCTEPDPAVTGLSPGAHGVLKACLNRYLPLIENDLWAVSPVPQLLTELTLYYTQKQNYTYATVMAAFVAVECDPYRHPAPFHAVRLKNLLMVVKLLVLTAESSAALRQSPGVKAAKAGVETRILTALAEIDQVSLSQMLLVMILKASPEGCIDEWDLSLKAKELHDDIMELKGREKELSLIHAWGGDGGDSESSRRFFEYAVVQQMSALAHLGRELLEADWGV